MVKPAGKSIVIIVTTVKYCITTLFEKRLRHET